ncbi:sigma-70 family RNA polymerase sigma factor [Oscillatoria sp. CS-180]|uniref:sigma-70 family RNA polymerase sigma factor n=1 Tax=Oscillatoria sp. CS-180 TaxID=3021720 RepID=UPI00232AE3A9|nr:sigma-70 family RNA polymerase sigma factor [Oscillatoria sp. CS-180]MDB9526476.1 sigma-70 family RNA polymerase sigma factor [Oscillatoria sp. CS-180]
MSAFESKASSSEDLSNLKDAEIVQVMHSGCLTALSILYRRYGGAVYRLALRILRSPDEAEDLTQEVFLTFWQTASYDPSRGTVLVFLLTIARSLALNRLKRSQAHYRRLLQWQIMRSPNPHSAPFENATLEELSKHVADAMKALPDNQRKVLEMAYYDGLSQSEITRRLNIPLGTVKTRSRLGLLKLRQLLKDWME